LLKPSLQGLIFVSKEEERKGIKSSWRNQRLRLPMYGELKLCFIVYLWSPKTKAFLRPYISRYETDIDRNLMEYKAIALDWAMFSWHYCVANGQSTFYQILEYLAAQSSRNGKKPNTGTTNQTNQIEEDSLKEEDESGKLNCPLWERVLNYIWLLNFNPFSVVGEGIFRSDIQVLEIARLSHLRHQNIVQYHTEWFSTVSVRQLWYELSAKDAFKISVKQWTRFMSTMLDDLVREVISEHYFLATECQLAVFESEVAAKFIKGPSKRTRSKSIATSEAATPPCKVNLQYPIEEDQPVLASLETSLKCREDSSILCYKRKKTMRSSEVKLGGQVDEGLRFYSNYDPNCFALSNVEDLDLSEDILVKNCDFDPNSVNLMDFGDDPICASACFGPSPFAQFSSSTAVDKEDVEDGMEGIKYNQEGTLFHDSKKWSWVRGKPTRFTPISEGCLSILDRDTWIMKLFGAEDYLDAVVDYLRIRQEKSCSGKRFELRDTGDRVRIHLCHLGWTACLHLTTTKESDWNIPEKKGALADAHSPLADAPSLMVVEHGYNPEAVMELSCGGELSASDLKVWGPKAVTSLIAMGWKYCCSIKQGEIYTSPHGKKFRSLQKACKELCMEGLSRLTKPTHRNVLGEKSKGLLILGNYALATVCTEVEEDVLLLPNRLSTKNCIEKSGLSQSRECEFDYMELKGVRATRKSRKDSSCPSTSSSLLSNRIQTLNCVWIPTISLRVLI
ncbi:hypothetical protein IFM89_019508, partial [Coptis chinensis]